MNNENEPPEEAVDFVLCARYGELDELREAMAAGIDVNVRSHGSATALLMASANGHLEVAQHLLDAGANTELANEAGNCPLHWAALNGHLSVCKLLLEKRADTNARNEFKRRAFDEAFGRNFPEICEFLAPLTNMAEDDQGDDEETLGGATGKSADTQELADEDEETKRQAAYRNRGREHTVHHTQAAAAAAEFEEGEADEEAKRQAAYRNRRRDHTVHHTQAAAAAATVNGVDECTWDVADGGWQIHSTKPMPDLTEAQKMSSALASSSPTPTSRCIWQVTGGGWKIQAQ